MCRSNHQKSTTKQPKTTRRSTRDFLVPPFGLLINCALENSEKWPFRLFLESFLNRPCTGSGPVCTQSARWRLPRKDLTTPFVVAVAVAVAMAVAGIAGGVVWGPEG